MLAAHRPLTGPPPRASGEVERARPGGHPVIGLAVSGCLPGVVLTKVNRVMNLALQQAAYHEHIRRGADELLSAIRTGPLDAEVSDCPGWTLRELVNHIGQVHQWARSVIETGSPERNTTGMEPDEDPVRWYEKQVDRLLSLLTSTDPKKPTWTLAPGYRFVDFWSRRQAHEVAMHAVDAARAVGRTATYDPELAADGIEEVLGVMVPRMARRTKRLPELPGPLLLQCTDRPTRWLLQPSPPPANIEEWQLDWRPVADDEPVPDSLTVRSGTAEALLLALWKRRADDGPSVDGDQAVAEAFFASKLTP